MEGSERRRHARHRFEIETQLRLDFDTVIELELEREYFEARTHDISAGGVSLYCPLSLPPGATFDLHIRIVEGQHAQTPPEIFSARAVWCTDIGGGRYQLGARFAGLDEKQLAKLERLISFIESCEEPDATEALRCSWASISFDLSDSDATND